MAAKVTLLIDGAEYVAIPRADYLRLTGEQPTNEALDFGLASLGHELRAAREHAGLSQAQLAKRLRKAQTTVSQSEAGKIRVSEAYVKKLLKVCGLPADWQSGTAGR